MTPKEAIELARKHDVKFVDLKFIDFPGVWQHTTIPATRLDDAEGAWNSGREEFPNLGYKVRHKEGYFPVPPTDTLANLRAEMMITLQETGVEVEVGHHEVASGGQCELGMKFARLLPCADQ